MRTLSSPLSALALLALFGCSATSTPADFEDGAGGAGATTGGGGAGGVGGDPNVGSGGSIGTGGSGTGKSCSAAAALIYVLSDANDLYSFEPLNKQFTKIGPLKCPTTMQPNSMAVDRDAVAWVNYVQSGLAGDNAGAIFKVNTADASCEPTVAVVLPNGWYRLGMGFSTDKSKGTDETLFVAGTGSGLSNSPGLGRIDMATHTLSPIGQFTGALSGQSGELTGTGDARLFGFFTTSPVVVAEIDKTSGATPSPSSLSQVQTPMAWAFSFWGGDFYLYTASASTNSNVTRYRPADGSTDTSYMANVGFRIVGAGVSTCAPTETPK
jgi:hypothetical protein